MQKPEVEVKDVFAHHANVVTVEQSLAELGLLLLAVWGGFTVVKPIKGEGFRQLLPSLHVKWEHLCRLTTLSRPQAPCLHQKVESSAYTSSLLLSGNQNVLILTDVVIETQQSTTKLTIGLHDDPDARSDALVDQLER